MMIFPMGDAIARPGSARKVGLGVAAGLVFIAGVIFFGNQHEWFAGRYLLLTTLEDLAGLEVSSPVYYQGVEIGRVAWIREPDHEVPGYKIRMRVSRSAFRRIALDARVRVDEAPRTGVVYVTILPGRDKPDRLFPGKVKVLEPVTRSEQWFRVIYDIIEGLEDLSKTKMHEADVEDLKAEIERLEKRIEEMEEKKNGSG